MKFTPNFSKTEWKRGLIAMCLSMLLVPGFLALIPGITDARINFGSFLADLTVVVVFLRRFLGKNITVSLDHPLRTLYLAALGYLGCTALTELVSVCTYWCLPEYVNLNDLSIQSQLASETVVMLLTTVVLAPVVEECFFRGLLFRGLYDRSPAAAWTASVALFAVVHVAGFIGWYSPMALLASFVTYIPAGVVLCVTYQRSGSIIAPILTHALVNLMAASAIVR